MKFTFQRRPDTIALITGGGGAVGTWVLLKQGEELGILAALATLWGLWRFVLSVTASREPLEITEQGLLVPIAFWQRPLFPWSQVELLELLGDGRRQRLVVSVAAHLAVFDSDEFEDPQALARVHEAAKAAILAQPGGEERLRRMVEGMEETRRVAALRAPATWVIVGLVTAGFLLEMFIGGQAARSGQNFALLLRMGGNVPVLVHDGEWWRLVTANFLHGGLVHLAVNALAILMLGAFVERLLGWQRMVGIYLFTAVAGAFASTALARAALSVGASTAAFGLLGAVAALHFRRDELPVGYRQPLSWWVMVLAINGLAGFLPLIDGAAHAGGFGAGIAVTWLLTRGRPLAPTPVGFQATALLAVTVLGTGAGLVVGAVRLGEHRELTTALRSVDANLPADDEDRNKFAWFIVIDPAATRAECAAARDLIARAAEALPSRSDIRDTYATALHRVGDWEGAVEQQHRAITDAYAQRLFDGLPRPGLFTQLARFYRAGDRPAREGVLKMGRGGPELGPAPPAGDVEVYALALRGDELLGLVHARVDTSREEGFTPHEYRPMPEAELEVVDVRPAKDSRLPPNTWTWWQADAETLSYP